MSISLSGLTAGKGDIYSGLLGSASSSIGGMDLMGSSSLLSDYASIKNGSYGKMLNAYYAKLRAVEDEDSSSKSKSTQAADSAASSSANAAYKSASALNSLDYSEENIDKVYSKVSAFIKDYNSMITSATKSGVSSVSQQANYLNNSTYAQYKLLASVGITMNADRTLSIDEETFKKAKVGTLKTLFKGSSSFASQVADRASQIYRYANSGKSSVANLYNGTGSYSSIDSSSMLNSIV
ncbi:MAG: hypothetical protein J1F41_05090 [Lachnospiraceae bacterium]|nr:hypothetical protein [Lachnospiraceae bacterium]